MFKSDNNIGIEQPSPRSFGIVFSIVFLIIALYPLLTSKNIHIWAIAVSIIFLFLALSIPKALALPNKLWFKFGLILGAIIAPITMAIVYITTVLPIGLIMRLLKKDLLNQKIDPNTDSYWIERSEPMGSMRNQF